MGNFAESPPRMLSIDYSLFLIPASVATPLASSQSTS
jgi:hypothetical protein